ncbi:translation initiation factor IF-2 [Anaerocolumna sp. AGMB13020]|uniref:translation initiation factor IF-2 n=1 Tax=Anaerocolumna sp. AGMB13020 TaxID=3081750 RepID=UPI0029547695|nr:translation initiation factor IF-2 [Anaerocolumna sp. AGMB13020]WOO36619.1 translation initiation factor IF-2 [Anaerocolumna sp. AGMB13020]
MAKIKIYELAKEINAHSKDIVGFLNEKGVDVKSHMSSIEDKEIGMVKGHFAPKANQAEKPASVEAAAIKEDKTETVAFNQSNKPQDGYTPNGSNSQRTGSSEHGNSNQYNNRSSYQGQRNDRDGNSRPYQGQRTGDNAGRPQQQGQRPDREGFTRSQGSRYDNNQNGNRPYQGNRPDNNQGQRPDREGFTRAQGQNSGYRQGGQNNQNRPYNNNRPQGQPYQQGQSTGESTGQNERTGYNQGYNNNGGNRPYNNNGGNSSYNNNGGNRPYNNNGTGGNRPYNNNGGNSSYNNNGTGGNRPYNNNGTGGNRPYNNNGTGGNSSYNNNGTGGNRPYNNNGTGGNRPYNNNGGSGSYNNGSGQGQYRSNDGQSRPYNNNRPNNGGGQRPAGNGNGFRPGGNYQGRPGGNQSYDRFGGMNKDKDEVSGDNRKRSTSSRTDTTKKFDGPIGMSRSDSAGTRNSRANKNTKNTKSNYDRNFEDNSNEIKLPKKGQFIKPKAVQQNAKEDEIKTIVIPEILTIKELADKMKMPAATLVKKLFLAGKMVSINQEITFEEAEEIAIEYEIIAEHEVLVDVIEELLKEEEEDTDKLEKRPPVVCVMGHVDHGKTSLLDAIRETHVTSHEAGGITQHIGAYVVEVNGEKITFLDTPGHEAFTSMRMRGAQSTDIAILVVAADDGVMPQTIEAISHAKAAGIQIIVAINKIDKPSANIERVKQELTEYELVAEDWGGDTVFVPVSAHTREGIEQLLEMIVLTSDLVELKANPNRNARGIVIEAELDKGRGPVATVLIQKGTLHVGDSIAIGSAYGKVRAMMDDKGRRVTEATPSTPVEILGLNEVPAAGEIFMATDTEKEARAISETYISQGREKLLADTKAKLSLDGLFSQIKAGNVKELNLIIKADVQGSVEAMKQSLVKLSNDEVAVRVIHGGVGAINESDVNLASASNAIIIGFNVRPDNVAKEKADSEKVDLRLYRVIYNAIEDVESAMKGMLEPIYEEKVIGHAEVRQVFKASGLGIIAGSYVLDGKIQRGSFARITREGEKIYEGSLASLKRFKDDVKEVATGYECGLVFEKFNDIKEFDQVELYIMEEVPRK